MPSDVTVRVATESDDRALAALDAVSWPESLQVVPPPGADEPFFADRRPASDVLVAEADGAILGYARLSRHMRVPSNDHVLHLGALVVSEAARGRGVGGLLMAAVIEEAGRRGAAKLGLRVLGANSTAIRLYQRYGFAEEARLRAELFIAGRYVDDVWMALWLRPEPATE